MSDNTSVTYPMRPMDGKNFTTNLVKRDARFLGEPKINGIRFMVDLETGRIENRIGVEVVDGALYESHVRLLQERFRGIARCVDCESWGRYKDTDALYRRALFVLDFVPVLDNARATYEERRRTMVGLLPVWNMGEPAEDGQVVLIPTGNACEMWNRCLPMDDFFVEGIVAKRRDSVYQVQLASPSKEVTTWVKFRKTSGTKLPVSPGSSVFDDPEIMGVPGVTGIFEDITLAEALDQAEALPEDVPEPTADSEKSEDPSEDAPLPAPALDGGTPTPFAPASSPDPVEFLAADNLALKRAGAKLAAAAQLVATEYDGVHRLHLALAEWNQTVADEGGRAERYGKTA